MSMLTSIDHLLGGILEEGVETEDESRIKLVRVPEKVVIESKNSVFSIEQGFVAKPNDDCDVRIRCEIALNPIEGNAVPEYTLTSKFRPLNQESEMEISREMFDALWESASSKQKKTRYKWNGWDIDQFEDGSVVAEYEKGIGERHGIPVCFEVAK